MYVNVKVTNWCRNRVTIWREREKTFVFFPLIKPKTSNGRKLNDQCKTRFWNHNTKLGRIVIVLFSFTAENITKHLHTKSFVTTRTNSDRFYDTKNLKFTLCVTTAHSIISSNNSIYSPLSINSQSCSQSCWSEENCRQYHYTHHDAKHTLMDEDKMKCVSSIT